MSIARWTPSPIVEREADRLRRDVLQKGRILFVVASLGLVGGVSLTVLLMTALVNGNAGLVALPLLCVIVWGFVRALAALDRERTQLRLDGLATTAALRQEFGADVGTLVRLRILQGDAPTGEDEGMLWIEENRLLFAGHRTSFALGPSQATGPCRKEKPIRGLRNAVRLTLRERTAAGPLALSLEPLDVDAERLQFEIDRWAKTIGPAGQLPPTEIGPGAPSPQRLLAGAVYATAFWTYLSALVVLSHGTNAVTFVLAAGIAPYIGASPPLVRWRAWRDRRRLERVR